MQNQSLETIVSCDKENVKIIRKSAILRNKDVAAYYRYIFNECDTNKDELISISELREFLRNNEGDIPDKVLRCLYNRFDEDDDDQFSFEEFLNMINNPTVMDTFKRIGSRYLKFVTESSVRKKSLKLRRTVTNTGLYEEEIRFNLCTVSVIVISILQIICYFVNIDCDNCIRDATEFDPGKKYEIWRYVTLVFDHSTLAHLLGNVAMQLLLGVPLEMVHSWRVPLIYFAGAIGGCLLQSAVLPYDGLVGGSPGLYSFYSAHIASVIMNWREMSHPIWHLIVFGILVGFDAIRNYIINPHSSRISYISHLGGVIVGLQLGLIILRNLKVTRVEMIVWYTSLVTLCMFFVGLIITSVVQDTM